MATESSLTLENTPTWAVAIVAAVFVFISFLIERAIFYIGSWLKKRNQTSLVEALEKIKEELMLVGFISLLLTVSQNRIAEICISPDVTRSMLPCERQELKQKIPDAAERGSSSCTSKGKKSFVPLEGLHQLHILIFVMAAVHVVYCVITITFGSWKVHRWRKWEDETKTEEYHSSHGAKLRYTRQSTFVMHHTESWLTKHPILSYMVAFFQQFFRSVSKTDYMTLRHGFIMTHMSTNIDFDFHKYILRSLAEDFQHIVGISPILWVFAVIFMLLNVYGWQAYFWLSFIPFLVVLVINTKLRWIIIKLAIEVTEKHSVVLGVPLVNPRDELFWFHRPQLMLFLIHFVLFQNAFELAYYTWGQINLGSKSCFQDYKIYLLVRFIIGAFVQVLCSYVTLPLYALVTQMGTHHKKVILQKHIAAALVEWHKRARNNAKNRKKVALENMENESRATSDLYPNPNFNDFSSNDERDLGKEGHVKMDKPSPSHMKIEMIPSPYPWNSSVVHRSPRSKPEKNRVEITSTGLSAPAKAYFSDD